MLAARERGAVGGGHRVTAPALDRRRGGRHRRARLYRDHRPGRPGPLHRGAARRRAGARRRVPHRAGRGRGRARRAPSAASGSTARSSRPTPSSWPWGRGPGAPPVDCRSRGSAGSRATASRSPRADVPAHALFVDYRTADGRHLEPEIFPRPDGEVYVCGMADPAPLPDSPDGVEVNEASCAVLARAAGRVSTALAAAHRQARGRPATGPSPTTGCR